MPIIAENKGGNFELVPAGNHVARCYSMIHIGTIEENFKGETKWLNKVRLTFELPNEKKVFREENGEQPFVISKEFTLSMHEKAALRKYLESWRGKAFTDLEAKSFDITALAEKPCMLNVIHKASANGNTYADISSISTMPKGFVCPSQINPTLIISYEDIDFEAKVEKLPDFLKEKIKKSKEWLVRGGLVVAQSPSGEVEPESIDKLPF